MVLLLTSPEFRHESAIPSKFTCEGANISPTLHFSGIPDGTRSLALIVEDPDAPDPAAPQRTFTHFILYNLPPDCGGLDEGVPLEQLPPGARTGKNDFEQRGWGGPCPPNGRHRYFFRLYALDCELPELSEPRRSDLLEALESHVIDQAELMGTYEKQR